MSRSSKAAGVSMGCFSLPLQPKTAEKRRKLVHLRRRRYGWRQLWQSKAATWPPEDGRGWRGETQSMADVEVRSRSKELNIADQTRHSEHWACFRNLHHWLGAQVMWQTGRPIWQMVTMIKWPCPLRWERVLSTLSWSQNLRYLTSFKGQIITRGWMSHWRGVCLPVGLWLCWLSEVPGSGFGTFGGRWLVHSICIENKFHDPLLLALPAICPFLLTSNQYLKLLVHDIHVYRSNRTYQTISNQHYHRWFRIIPNHSESPNSSRGLGGIRGFSTLGSLGSRGLIAHKAQAVWMPSGRSLHWAHRFWSLCGCLLNIMITMLFEVVSHMFIQYISIYICVCV